MPRTKRSLLSRSYYHVMTRGNNKNVVFRSDEDCRYYLELLFKYKIEHPFDLYHYCLMPNHIHLLIQTKSAADFAIFMKKINLAYFYHYKKEYGWVGHFWQDRYKSQPVGKDAYFVQCGKYIELNPVRAGLVLKPEDYIYSSYEYYASGKPNHLVMPDPIYIEMANNDSSRQRQYREIMIDQIIADSYQKEAWGSDQQRYRETDKVTRKS